jgi:biotin carboxylase
MFFFNERNNETINQGINKDYINQRYNLDMISKKIKEKKEQTEQIDEKKNKIKSLKISGPKNNKKWSEDIFEEIKYEEQKQKIKKLKLIEPIKQETNIIDPTYISDWNDPENDWIEKDNNICV